MLTQILTYKENPKEEFPDTSEFEWDEEYEVWRGKPEYVVAYQEERASSFSKNKWYSEDVLILDKVYPFVLVAGDTMVAGWGRYDSEFSLSLSSFYSNGDVGCGTVIYWEKVCVTTKT